MVFKRFLGSHWGKTSFQSIRSSSHPENSEQPNHVASACDVAIHNKRQQKTTQEYIQQCLKKKHVLVKTASYFLHQLTWYQPAKHHTTSKDAGKLKNFGVHYHIFGELQIPCPKPDTVLLLGPRLDVWVFEFQSFPAFFPWPGIRTSGGFRGGANAVRHPATWRGANRGFGMTSPQSRW